MRDPVRIPEILLQINPVPFVENDPFFFKHLLLLFITCSWLEGYNTPTIHNAMLGQSFLFRAGMENPDHPADRWIKTGHESDLTVGRHFCPL